jgi:coenzyme F420-0:L-glutamate ligase / coenzyme F420-1:gamma-L-glutamate ligase
MSTFSSSELNFIQRQRVGRFATADQDGRPHIVPVCYACDGAALYIALDTKPKRVEPQRLKRVRNLLANPQVALLVDHYSDDWSELAFVLIRGTAELVPPEATEHRVAIELLRDRYPQYREMPIQEQPVIAIRPTAVTAWGAPAE